MEQPHGTRFADLRRIADREGMWLHVDAAYGGGMLLSRQHAGALPDRVVADLDTLDPHKWFFAPLDAGAILVKDENQLTRSVGMQPAYLTDPPDVRNERYNYYVHGFEQSRRFRSLKVWMEVTSPRPNARGSTSWWCAAKRRAGDTGSRRPS